MNSTLRLSFIPSKQLPNFQNKCNLSAQQAAAALRPFYFAVHPDRFGQDPKIRQKNEKSLQIFNGYLNELFPNTSTTIKPVKVEFSIMKNDELQHVSINLSGKDPHQIVEDALKKLNNFYESTTSSDIDEMWKRMKENDVKIRKKKGFYIKPNDLFANLVKNREAALSKMEANKKLQEHLQDEIDYMKTKLKIKEITWAINWDQSYMRRCLTNIHHMIKHSSNDEKLRILQAMENTELIFNRKYSFEDIIQAIIEA
uniref:DUF4460 domain-containing protein n=1 Tax=Panagrolaimus sp. JU765 TaxID=591449 RepID=A0AC34QG38_9BILA